MQRINRPSRLSAMKGECRCLVCVLRQTRLSVRRETLLTPDTNQKASERARRSVLRAIKAGQLVRPPICELCGTHKDDPRLVLARGYHYQAIQAHHLDYGQPLKVMWLCIPCHQTLTNGWDILFHLNEHHQNSTLPRVMWWCWLCQRGHIACPAICPPPYPLPPPYSPAGVV